MTAEARADVWATLDEHIDPAQWRPQLADDIQTATFPIADGGAYVMVANSRDLVFYRFTLQEAALLPLLDGRRSVADIVVDLLDDAGGLGIVAVVSLVRLLERGGFLTTRYLDVYAAVEHALHPPTVFSRVTAFVRTLTIEWSHADAAVRFLYQHFFRHLLTRTGLILAGVVSVLGATAFADVVSRHSYRLQNRHFGIAFVVLLCLDLAIIALHELGHAAVLVHFGRRVKSAGFRIYFGTPSFFIESSDALMLPRKRRMLQAAAGPATELVGTSVASLALWAFPGGATGHILYQFVIINYFVLFLNLVPFLELDGYWILSDALQRPDLRPESLGFVRRELWHKLGRREQLTRREVGLAVYGIAGVLFTIASLISAWFFWRRVFGSSVISMWHGGLSGRLLLLAVVVLLLGPVLRALFGLIRSVARVVHRRFNAVRFRWQSGWRIEAAALIDSSGAFGDVPVQVLNDIAGRVRLRSVPRGVALVRQGDVADAYYVVRSGRVDVLEERSDGTEPLLLRTLERGEGFGEMGLITAARRSATVRAATPAQVYELDKAAFERLLLSRATVEAFAATWQQLQELAALAPFGHLGADDLRSLAAEGQWVNVAPGVSLMTQGEPGDAFYVVASGQLDVVQDGQTVATVTRGGHVGELALLLDQPRSATVTATTPARLFRLDRDGFATFVAASFRRGTLPTSVAIERDWDH